MEFKAALQQRQLTLTSDGQPVLAVALDQGGRYRLVAPDLDSIGSVVAALERLPGVAVLAPDGGLLGAMTVAENLSLALSYGQSVDAVAMREWEYKLQLAFRLCGISEERQRTLGRALPCSLERTERWLVGFVLQLLRASELLVLDRAFAGLSRRQAEAVLALESVYHQFIPSARPLFVDPDAHGLPVLPECRAVVELEVQPCPS